jgi:ABC-type multidrug transport system fused ATPase/permease subunit
LLSWLRRQLGLVSQEATLFADTIEGNIKLGCPDASMDDVVDAAMQANCHDFISEFPDGYKTFLGEGGSLVSGKGYTGLDCVAFLLG